MKNSKEPLFYIETLEPSCDSNLCCIWSNLDGSTTTVLRSGDVDTRKKMTQFETDEIYGNLWSVILGTQKTRTTDADFPFTEHEMRRTPLGEILQGKTQDHKRIVKFIRTLASHPQVECNYKGLDAEHFAPPKKGVKFRIVVPEYEKNRMAEGLANQANAIVLYSKMSLENQRRVAYYFGFNADGYDKDALLVDFFHAKIYNSPEACAKFLKTFTDAEVIDDAVSDLVVIKKAMLLSQEDGEPFEFRNNQYFLGDKYVGADAEGILGYFKERKSDFAALCGNMGDMITAEEQKRFLANKSVSKTDAIAAVAGGALDEGGEDDDESPAATTGAKAKGGKKAVTTKKDDDDMPY